jgi:hypothetical protein
MVLIWPLTVAQSAADNLSRPYSVIVPTLTVRTPVGQQGVGEPASGAENLQCAILRWSQMWELRRGTALSQPGSEFLRAAGGAKTVLFADR